jgi:hypothetical protein
VHHPRCSSRSGHLDARAPLVPSPEGYVGRRRRGADGIGAVRGVVLVRVRIIFFISSSGGRELIFFALTQIE